MIVNVLDKQEFPIGEADRLALFDRIVPTGDLVALDGLAKDLIVGVALAGYLDLVAELRREVLQANRFGLMKFSLDVYHLLVDRVEFHRNLWAQSHLFRLGFFSGQRFTTSNFLQSGFRFLEALKKL